MNIDGKSNFYKLKWKINKNHLSNKNDHGKITYNLGFAQHTKMKYFF